MIFMAPVTKRGANFGSALQILVVGFALCMTACCGREAVQPVPPPKPATSITLPAEVAGQRIFATPQEAVDALVAATRAAREDDLLKIMGAGAEKLISSGDKVADERGREKFLAAYDKAHAIEKENDDRMILVVGEEEWPMPIPLITSSGGWRFDTASGEKEILNRRIGRNELMVVEICRSYVEAQEEFAAQSPSGDEYAQRFRSQAGKHDGLYWPTADGQPESPFGSLIADATAEGYGSKALGNHAPYHGYYFQILKGQGAHASDGAKSYLVKGRMVGGFAMIAFPARYGDSGVMTFMVNQHGIVFEKNLGANTVKIARAITQFDPDETWSIVR